MIFLVFRSYKFIFGAIVYLEEPIKVARQVVKATPDNHPSRSRRISNLATKVGHLYERTGAESHLQEAMSLLRGPIDAVPDGHPDQAVLLNNLTVLLRGNHDHLEEVICLSRKFPRMIPEDDFKWAKRCSNLAVLLNERHLKSQSMDNIEEAVQSAKQAAAAIPNGHLDQAGILNNLGYALCDLYSAMRAEKDVEAAAACFESSLQHAGSRTIDRIRGGAALLLLPDSSVDPQRAYGAASSRSVLSPG